MIVNELKKKYQKNLNSTNYKEKSDFNPTIYLFQNWAYKIPPKWFGFSLDNSPFVWGQILDEFLQWVDSKCPDFKILQIKLKYGSIRAFLDLNCSNAEIVNEVSHEIEKLEDWLQHKDLIY